MSRRSAEHERLRWDVRDAEPDDLAYILQTWWGLSRRTPPWQQFQLEALAKMEDVTVRVAHDLEDPSAIWAFHVPGHVTYARRFVRGSGIEQDLLRPQPQGDTR